MSKKRRRIKGSGSVYTRKDGRVVGQYEVNGQTRYIYGRDEKQIADKVAEAIKNRDSGIDSENMTVGGYLDKWLTAIKDTVRIGTWKQYEIIVRLHLKPTLGTVKLDKLAEPSAERPPGSRTCPRRTPPVSSAPQRGRKPSHGTRSRP